MDETRADRKIFESKLEVTSNKALSKMARR
jgi:hypothetical protein